MAAIVDGPDSRFSLEPDEFAEMVRAVLDAQSAIGEVSYEVTPAQESARKSRRSLFAVADITQGEVFTPLNVRSIRPGNGLLPKLLPEVLGQKALTDIAYGTPLTMAHFMTD